MNQIKFTGRNWPFEVQSVPADFLKTTMKLRQLFLAIFCFICLSQADAQNLPNRPSRTPTPNDDLVSFQVNDDQSATFRLYAPNAKYVELRAT
jgi:hypothetical protein